ncbi:hypothetical protein FOL46_009258 [Perkinsus olseni]|uniref:Uncharacterized protein n=1 Tax=Perkinsus olseni TaxID=32597 RepID=A0A7J6MLP7_PEROL|nr:hypothetical protein FOL46_009258 [Perkinsus olseni]
MSTLSTDDRPILADHSAGCNGGLGPLVGSTIRVQDSTCVYGIQGRTVDGLNHRNLKIEVNIVEGAADSADSPNVTVETTGLARMLFHHHNGMNFTWHDNPDDILFNGTDYGSAYPILLLFAYSLFFALSTDELSVTADFPANCEGGPGLVKGGNIGASSYCLYHMYGRNSDGFYQNSTGIIFKTNDPDHYGDMKVQLNVVEADPMEPAKVTVETSGWVHMLKEYPGFKGLQQAMIYSISTPLDMSILVYQL